MDSDPYPFESSESKEELVAQSPLRGSFNRGFNRLQETVDTYISLLQSDDTVPKDLIDQLAGKWRQLATNMNAELTPSLEGLQDGILATKKIEEAKTQLTKACFEDISANFATSHPKVVAMFSTVTRLANAEFRGSMLFEEPLPEVTQTTDEAGNYFSERLFKNRKWFQWSVITSALLSALPIHKWLPKYSIRNDLLGDVLAALTVSMMAVPQGMAYALIAQIPPVYGLYCGTLPMLMYTFFGTSSELSVGPAAMVSVTIPNAIGSLADPGTDEYIALVLFLSLVIGIALLLAGLLRFGFVLENLLSTPILNGFTQGAGVLIICSQLKHLFRISVPGNASTAPAVIGYILTHFGEFHVWTFLCSAVTISIIIIMRKINSRIPNGLIVLIVTTLVVWAARLDTKIGLKTIGDIPRGFPAPKLISATFNDMFSAITPAIIVAIIGFIEAISSAKTFAARKHYKVDTSQEMIALGISNIVGSVFQAYPAGASLARTAVNFQSGVRTQLNQLIAGTILIIVLVALTPLFYFTPLFVLAAIVATGAVSLINLQEPKFLWKTKEKGDLIELYVTMSATAIFGPIVGVMTAISLAVLEFVYRSATPAVYEEGRLPDTIVYKDITIYPSASTFPGILILRVDARLAFYNVAHFREQLYLLQAKSKSQMVIIDAGGMSYIDSTAIHNVEDIVEDFQKKDISIWWADVKGHSKSALDYSGMTKKIGESSFFPTVHAAIEEALAKQSKASSVQDTIVVAQPTTIALEEVTPSPSYSVRNSLADIFINNPVVQNVVVKPIEKIKETVNANENALPEEKLIWV